MGVYLTEAQEDVIYDFIVEALDNESIEVLWGFQAEDAPSEPYVALMTTSPPVREGNPQHRHIAGQQFAFAMRYRLTISVMIHDAPEGEVITRKIQNAFKLPKKLKILQDGGFANRGILFVSDLSAIFKTRYQRVSLIDFELSFVDDVNTGLPVVESIEFTGDLAGDAKTITVDDKQIYTLDFSVQENSMNIPLI